MNHKLFNALALVLLLLISSCSMGESWVSEYDLVWRAEGDVSSISMPLAGSGGMKCGVYVDNNHLVINFHGSSARDTLSNKNSGRLRIMTSPDIFHCEEFEQRLSLDDGAIYISSNSEAFGSSRVKLWSEVNAQILHVEIQADSAIKSWVSYECDLAPGEQVDDMDEYFSVGSNSLQFESEYQPEPYLNSIFGGLILADDLLFLRRQTGRYRDVNYLGFVYRIKRSRSSHIRAVTHLASGVSREQWGAELSDIVANNIGDDMELLWMDSRLWWRNFWEQNYHSECEDMEWLDQQRDYILKYESVGVSRREDNFSCIAK